MRKIKKMFFVIITIISIMMVNVKVCAADATAGSNVSTNVMATVNQIRKDNGLSELTYNVDTQLAANIRAQEASMCWSHTRPDGTDFWSVDSRIFGENLGMTTDINPVTIVDHWMNSQTHKELLLAEDFKTASIGVYVSANVTYVTMEFSY